MRRKQKSSCKLAAQNLSCVLCFRESRGNKWHQSHVKDAGGPGKGVRGRLRAFGDTSTPSSTVPGSGTNSPPRRRANADDGAAGALFGRAPDADAHQLRRVGSAHEGLPSGPRLVGAVSHGDVSYYHERNAMITILRSLPSDVLLAVGEKETAKEAWDAIAT